MTDHVPPVPHLRPADEIDPTHLPALKAEVERAIGEAPRTISIAVEEHDYRALKRFDRARVLTAQDRRLLDLYDVRVTVDGEPTPDVTAVIDELRALMTAVEPEPDAYLVTPRPSRRERRRAAALMRRRTA